MKKTKLKGFTLIECIIALAILGVSSALIVQAYAQLMKITKMNNTMYTSISRQMEDAESRNDGHSALISQSKTSTGDNKIDPDKAIKDDSGKGQAIFLYKVDKADINKPYSDIKDKPHYAINVDVYCVKPYKSANTSDYQLADSDGDGTDVRYIYFHR